MLTSILLLNYLSIATAYHIPRQLQTRQAVCDPSEAIVGACGTTDLTSANWQAFNIDDFLSNFISVFGNGAASGIPFPQFFVNQNIPPGSSFSFDCTATGSCSHPEALNSAFQSDCAFQGTSSSSSNVCNRYITPEAGFVVENYVRLTQSITNNMNAIGNAGSNILASTFIDEVVDGLSAQQGNVFKAVVEAVASVFISIFPFRGVAQVAASLFDKLGTALFVTGQDGILTSPFAAVGLILENEAIQDEAERTKDQLKRQIQEIISSSQGRLQQAHDIIFGTGPGSAASQPESERDNIVFRQADSGAFLDIVEDFGELSAAMENNLKNFIVSSVMKGQQWSVLLSPRELFDDPAIPGGVCRDGFGGIPFILGAECALFRKTDQGEFGDQAARPAVLEGLIDVVGAITNARECAGASLDGTAVVEGTDPGVARLPTCLYDFPVEQL